MKKINPMCLYIYLRRHTDINYRKKTREYNRKYDKRNPDNVRKRVNRYYNKNKLAMLLYYSFVYYENRIK